MEYKPVELIDNKRYDYTEKTLILKLNRPVDIDWINRFYELSYNGMPISDFSPKSFKFDHDQVRCKVTVPLQLDKEEYIVKQAQESVDYLKKYLTAINNKEHERLEKEHQQQKEREDAESEKQEKDKKINDYIRQNLKI